MIEYIFIFVVAFALGYILAIQQHINSVPYQELKDEETISNLRKEISYYKDLCLWHVEEKEKLKREHYINE